MGAQMAMPPFLVISAATKPMRRMLMSRCSFEKPSSDGEVLAHEVAVEQGDRPAADLQQLDQQRVGEGRLAGAGEAGEEDREALPVRARRVAARQLALDLREGEPGRDLAPRASRWRSSVPERASGRSPGSTSSSGR